jgi:hypothetical protein
MAARRARIRCVGALETAKDLPEQQSVGQPRRMRVRPFVRFLLAGLVIAVGSSAAAAETPSPSVFTLPYKGFNYVSYYNGGYENANSLAALAATGANAAALSFEYGINVQNSTVYADPNYTDGLTVVGTTIAEAKAKGMSVMVRPLIDFLDPTKIGSYHVGDWRSYYNPADPAVFFASYQQMIVSVAQTAQANGADMLCIGVELDQLTGPAYQADWSNIIAAVRQVFSGMLTYSAEWNADASPWQGHHGLPAGTGNLVSQISFWSQVDFLGIDEYAPISDAAQPTHADLVNGWMKVPTDASSRAITGPLSLIAYFIRVTTQVGKPLLFTELGYESASDAAISPAGTTTNVYDPVLQAALYSAFFDAWRQHGQHALAGVYFWNWDPNAAEVGPGHGPNFSPQKELTQSVVKINFRQ